MTIKINFTLFEPWKEKVKMKSSPLLLSAFTDRSLNCLYWLQDHSSHRCMNYMSTDSLWHIGQRDVPTAPAAGRARTQAQTAGASMLDTLYAKLCMVRNYQHVSGSGLLAKALFPLPRICSAELHLIVLNFHWRTECSPGSSLPRKKQYHNWKKRWENWRKA